VKEKSRIAVDCSFLLPMDLRVRREAEAFSGKEWEWMSFVSEVEARVLREEVNGVSVYRLPIRPPNAAENFITSWNIHVS